MAHGDGHLPVASLEALYSRERRTFEILLKCRRNGVGAFRRQEAQLELLLILHEPTGTLFHRIRYLRIIFHAVYYSKQAVPKKN